MDDVLQQEKLWTIPFLLITTVNFLICVGNFMMLATFPLLILQIGGSKLMAGLITGIYSLTAFISRLQVGPLLDRKGRASILLAGLSMMLLITTSYNIAAYSVILLLLLRAIHGIGWSVVTTSTSTIASDIIPAARRSEGMGFFGISTAAAMVVGPGLGLYIMERSGYTSLFILAACFIILSLITGFSASYRRQSTQLPNGKPMNATPKQNIKLGAIEKTALYPSFLFFIIVTTYSSIMIFLPPYASERGVQDIGLFFTVIALAMMFTRLTTGQIADRCGTARIVMPGMFFFGNCFTNFIYSGFIAHVSMCRSDLRVRIRLSPASANGIGHFTCSGGTQRNSQRYLFGRAGSRRDNWLRYLGNRSTNIWI